MSKTEVVNLYSKDSKDRIRIWCIYAADGAYFTTDGLVDGKIKEWTKVECKPKNVGRSNATTAETQAESEMLNLIAKKRKEGYYDTRKEAEASLVFLPMLAHKYQDYSKRLSFPYFSQPKLDGARAFAVWEENRVVLYSRTGREYVSCPHICEALTPLLVANQHLIFDGELYNHSYKNNFEDLMSIIRKAKPTAEDLKLSAERVEFHMYDCFSTLAPNAPFSARTQLMVTTGCLVAVPTVLVQDEATRDSLYAAYTEEGYEGQMLRTAQGLYGVDRRSPDLLKRKEFHDEEFEVVNIQEGKGTWAGRAKTITVKLTDGSVCDCGIRGNFEHTKHILDNKKDYIGKLATVRYFEKTAYGALRFGVVLDIDRHDVKK